VNIRSRSFSLPRRALLIALDVLLLGVLTMRLWQGTAMGEVAHDEPARIGVPDVSLITPQVQKPSETIRTHAIFHTTRQFYVAPTPLQVEQKPPPDYHLNGAFAAPGKPLMALLSGTQGKPAMKVREGDVLEGWNVISVNQQRVVLKRDEETIELRRASASGAPSGGGLQSTAMNAKPASIRSAGVVVLGGSTGSAVATGGTVAPLNGARPVISPRVP